MKIVGCDLHTGYQQIAMLDEETREFMERRLEHARGKGKEFYRQLREPARVGIEATGHTRWFERLLGELGHELWMGDAARIRAAEVRKQKTDARDAGLLLELLLSGRFPRLWRPTLCAARSSCSPRRDEVNAGSAAGIEGGPGPGGIHKSGCPMSRGFRDMGITNACTKCFCGPAAGPPVQAADFLRSKVEITWDTLLRAHALRVRRY